MEYFKKLSGEEITVDVGRANNESLTDTLEDYVRMGYREFKLELLNTSPREYKVTARGDRDVIKKKIAKWYPDVLGE